MRSNRSSFGTLLVASVCLAVLAEAAPGWGRDLRWRESDSMGERGRGRNELRHPVDVGILSDGTVIALDREEEALVVFSDRGRYERTLGGSRGVTIPELSEPEALGIDEEDRLWVVDSGNHRIVVLDPQGRELFTVGSLGSSSGRFRHPAGIAFDGRGRAYVADTGNSRIQILRTRNGQLLAEWDGRTGGRRGHLDSPVAAAYSDQGPGGLWVLNRDATGIELFDREGEWQKTLSLPEAVEGETSLRDVVVEPTLYRMFLADSSGKRVLVLNRRGEWMAELEAGDEFEPRGVAVTRQLDLYVADVGGERIVTFMTR